MRWRSWLRAAAFACACVGVPDLVALAAAQPAGPVGGGASRSSSAGRLEVGGAVGWAGSYSLGTEQATLTGNGVPSGSPTVLFAAASSIDGGPTFEGRVGWRVSRVFTLEGMAGVTRSQVRTRITGDFEGADPLDVTEHLNIFTIEGGVLAHLHALAFAGDRLVPFITGGGGYLRQLHDGQTLATDGASGYVGAGLKYRLRDQGRGWIKAWGLRGDVRVRIHSGGFDLGDDRLRAHPAVSGGLYVRF